MNQHNLGDLKVHNVAKLSTLAWVLAMFRRRTSVQQLTCNIDFSCSFYFLLFFSFVLVELKPFVLKGKVLGVKLRKSAKKCENSETNLPLSCCPLVFP